jgi:hypothetical protein
MYNAKCMDIDQIAYSQLQQGVKARISRESFAVEMYSREFVEYVGGGQVAAVRQGANFGSNNRVPAEVRMRKLRGLENLRCEYKELPYDRTVIMLV